MLPTVRIVAEGHAPPLLEAVHHTLPTIRIREGIDDHDDLIQDVPGHGIGSCRKLIDREDGRLGPCGLTSVNIVGKPGHRRVLPDDGVQLALVRTSGIGQPTHIQPDLLQPGMVGGTGDGQEHEVPTLVGDSVRSQRHAIAGRRHRSQVGFQLVMGREVVSDFIAQERGRGRYGGIVRSPWEPVETPGGLRLHSSR